MPSSYDQLIALQSGVVSRRQCHEAGLTASDLQRMLRRRELTRVHDGVFVDHTGELSWLQRAWAAVLALSPAALAGESAVRAADGPGRRGSSVGRIHVAVDRHRHVAAPAGVTLHRVTDLQSRVRWNTSPPRMRIEEALIDVAARQPGDVDAVATLADAVQVRRTTAGRLLTTLDARPRIARRAFLHGVLEDIAQGTCSVLERGYLDLVERPHGLPTGGRQVQASAKGPICRDVVYADQAQVVELDGRLWHDSAERREADMSRDLAAAVDRLGTVRVGYGQVFRTPCLTAEQVGALLRARGWIGVVTPCPACITDAA